MKKEIVVKRHTSIFDRRKRLFEQLSERYSKLLSGQPSEQLFEPEPIQKHPPEAESNPAQFSKPHARSVSVLRELGGLGLKVVIIIIAFGAIFTFIYGFHQNKDPDMAPMLKTGDLVLFYRSARDYSIGELLLLDFQGQRQVRRVAARAGDTVDITDGGLVINGAMQLEPEIYEQTRRYETGPEFPLTLGPGEVFVLGDARENATDSRVYGPVNTKDTLGTVITIVRRRNL